MMKTCSKCHVAKEKSAFGPRKGVKDGLRSECNQCRNSRPYNPRQQLNRYLKSAYNITLKEYDEMLAKQNNLCLICGSDYPGKQGRFVVDHNHTTGEVRGLLCNQCNVGLGALKDSPSLLLKAAQFLIDRGHYGPKL